MSDLFKEQQWSQYGHYEVSKNDYLKMKSEQCMAGSKGLNRAKFSLAVQSISASTLKQSKEIV